MVRVGEKELRNELGGRMRNLERRRGDMEACQADISDKVDTAKEVIVVECDAVAAGTDTSRPG